MPDWIWSDEKQFPVRFDSVQNTSNEQMARSDQTGISGKKKPHSPGQSNFNAPGVSVLGKTEKFQLRYLLELSCLRGHFVPGRRMHEEKKIPMVEESLKTDGVHIVFIFSALAAEMITIG